MSISADPPNQYLTKIYWKAQPAHPEKAIESKPSTMIPGTLYVGTLRANAPSTTHEWKFYPGFVRVSGIVKELRLARGFDNSCPNPGDITAERAKYPDSGSTQLLLSGVIYFGNMYKICSTRSIESSAGAARAEVRRLYCILNATELKGSTRLQRRRFSGHMDGLAAGQCP